MASTMNIGVMMVFTIKEDTKPKVKYIADCVEMISFYIVKKKHDVITSLIHKKKYLKNTSIK